MRVRTLSQRFRSDVIGWCNDSSRGYICIVELWMILFIFIWFGLSVQGVVLSGRVSLIMKLLSCILLVCYWWLVVCLSFRVKSVFVFFMTYWYNYLQGEMTLRGTWFDVLMILTSVLAFKVCSVYWHVCLSGCWM